jgi:transcriptional regulator with XRE-family HTH domain
MDAQAIRALRERLGDTQEDFAKRFGVERTTVTMWEKNGTPKAGSGRNHCDRIISELQGELDVDGGADCPAQGTSRA